MPRPTDELATGLSHRHSLGAQTLLKNLIGRSFPPDLSEGRVSTRCRLLHALPSSFEKTAAAKADAVRAPMPGRIVSVRAEVGAEGTELLVMEAMKMELSLKAPRAGKIAELRATVSDFVEADAVLVRLE